MNHRLTYKVQVEGLKDFAQLDSMTQPWIKILQESIFHQLGQHEIEFMDNDTLSSRLRQQYKSFLASNTYKKKLATKTFLGPNYWSFNPVKVIDEFTNAGYLVCISGSWVNKNGNRVDIKPLFACSRKDETRVQFRLRVSETFPPYMNEKIDGYTKNALVTQVRKLMESELSANPQIAELKAALELVKPELSRTKVVIAELKAAEQKYIKEKLEKVKDFKRQVDFFEREIKELKSPYYGKPSTTKAASFLNDETLKISNLDEIDKAKKKLLKEYTKSHKEALEIWEKAKLKVYQGDSQLDRYYTKLQKLEQEKLGHENKINSLKEEIRAIRTKIATPLLQGLDDLVANEAAIGL